MHREDIKSELRKRFGSLKAFEASVGLGKEAVRDVLRGRSSRKTAVAIADALGKPLNVVFPKRFPIAGEDTSRKRDVHRLNNVAA